MTFHTTSVGVYKILCIFALQKEHLPRKIMKKALFLAAFLSCIMTTFISTGCKQKPIDDLTEMDTTAVIINLDSIVLIPFLPWDAMLADLKIHLEENYADWTVKNKSLEYDEGTKRWKMTLVRGNIQNIYYFADKEGNFLKFVSFLYTGSMPLEPVKAEMERNGFIWQGFMDFPGNDSKECNLYLSPSGALEVQVAGWENGSWILTFQPQDPEDFKYIVDPKKKKRKK